MSYLMKGEVHDFADDPHRRFPVERPPRPGPMGFPGREARPLGLSSEHLIPQHTRRLSFGRPPTQPSS